MTARQWHRFVPILCHFGTEQNTIIQSIIDIDFSGTFLEHSISENYEKRKIRRHRNAYQNLLQATVMPAYGDGHPFVSVQTSIRQRHTLRHIPAPRLSQVRQIPRSRAYLATRIIVQSYEADNAAARTRGSRVRNQAQSGEVVFFEKRVFFD